MILDAVSDHTAEWYYLSGIIDLRQGQYESAYDRIAQAYTMQPSHSEYRNAYLSLKKTGNPYRRTRKNKSGGRLFGLFCNKKRR